MIWLVLITAICLNAAANILVKVGMHGYQGGSVLELLRDRWLSPSISGGILCFVLTLVAYSYVLSRMNLSIAYPLMTGLGFIIISVASVILFKEQIGAVQMLGYGLIIFGVWLVARSGT
jgi:multidrug transporter EmrE-like cation transporter